MPEPSPNVRSIFDRALEVESEAGRRVFLDEACAGAPAVRQQVEALLAAHAAAGSFLEAPPSAVIVDTGPTVDQPPFERPGTQIGPYKLLQQIGEGGFGIVFMAEQVQPVRRRVALKVVKPGMDTRQVIARFEMERQALAVMDHPNIARVLDAGTTESGRPYFVMELVRGVPITAYCDENNLPVRERLRLFASVCQAIQHAHTKGIIHRDIKPTNVLVTRLDGQPVVKVIDFGVAKAMGQQLTDKTLFTNFAQMIGTPLYMSPEQAELSGVDVDTRSDIYALGVLLYELLTGSTPFSKEQLKRACFDEIRRIIREDEPPRPSNRISTAESAPSIAAHRHTEPAKLARLVRGELDWIVMKALEKDRSRRYETANGLAADVLHYLADEPVLACPPSFGYRLWKFARQNKAALATAAVMGFMVLLVMVNLTVATAMIVVVALVLGTALSTSQAIRASAAEKLAQTRLQAETKARNEAEQARQELEEKVRQIALNSKYKSDFLANMSHELRNPLNNLSISSDELAKNPDGNLTSQQKESAKTIQVAGSDLLNFIDDILDLSKLESGTVEIDLSPMRLDDLRHFVEQTFRHVAATKNVEFSIKFSENLPESMLTDYKRLRQTIKNLLFNAFKFTQQGSVSLSVQPVLSSRETDRENLNSADQLLAFEVADTGIGISTERQRTIFEAFQQVDTSASRKHGGTGLGLAISHELSRLLGGEIRVASSPGRGSTFTLYIPQTYRSFSASRKLRPAGAILNDD
jgi:signal transduction histidine kinase/tRNA A-37 threonylcarbamoyl transferase component Bud32